MKEPTISLNDSPEMPFSRASNDELQHVVNWDFDEITDLEDTPGGTPDVYRAIAAALLQERG